VGSADTSRERRGNGEDRRQGEVGWRRLEEGADPCQRGGNLRRLVPGRGQRIRNHEMCGVLCPLPRLSLLYIPVRACPFWCFSAISTHMRGGSADSISPGHLRTPWRTRVRGRPKPPPHPPPVGGRSAASPAAAAATAPAGGAAPAGAVAASAGVVSSPVAPVAPVVAMAPVAPVVAASPAVPRPPAVVRAARRAAGQPAAPAPPRAQQGRGASGPVPRGQPQDGHDPGEEEQPHNQETHLGTPRSSYVAGGCPPPRRAKAELSNSRGSAPAHVLPSAGPGRHTVGGGAAGPSRRRVSRAVREPG
jgi:hypothetical protein